MKNELDKMKAGEPYDFSKPEIIQSLQEGSRRTARLNRTSPEDTEVYRQALQELIPGIPDSTMVLPPFYCDYGHRIELGENVFINMNCTFLDSGGIRIGDHTLIGPNCQLYTPHHPLDYLERRKPIETGRGIRIGADCWLGGGVIVCPGVTIGSRCIVAAGSVVTRDVPDDSLVAGNPAVIKRRLP